MLMCCVTTMFVVDCLFLNPAITMLRVWGFHIELWVCDDGVCRNAGSVSRHGLEFFCRRSLRRRRRRRRPLPSPREAEGFLLKGCGRWGAAGRRDRVCCPRGAEGARRWGCATDMHATKVGINILFFFCACRMLSFYFMNSRLCILEVYYCCMLYISGKYIRKPLYMLGCLYVYLQNIHACL